ncbi:hypothetical protein H6F78_23465 [Coleofasciculus sp. FACHB-64]|uniref:hypothetical protein n=1 Tax=Cyanophyceae TaxID=3028117 RepID=UPI0016838754|nr:MULTISPECIES: hypothetical protein [unclassified Coleofasciculus]MBD1838926.1 hypothetical protein [Coleofasciculus sp. FACHB-501]MBD2048517.1 hypothetical protein [Coleofasciculus sp. FACHB-64]
MTTNLFKYLLIVENPELQALLLLVLILSSDSVNLKKASAVSFVIQAGLIDIGGIISVMSGTSLPLVILMMLAQGVYLIIDAHRAEKSGQ